VRHFTLTEADLAAVLRRRGDHNRLGYALMLCLLRHPGRPLRAGERPPAPLLAFVADQLDVLPECFDAYLAAERTRQRHAVECQEELGLRPFGRRAAAELMSGLLEPGSRTISSPSWRHWSCRRVASVGLSLPLPRPWNGCAPNSATPHAGRPTAG